MAVFLVSLKTKEHLFIINLLLLGMQISGLYAGLGGLLLITCQKIK